MESDSSEDEANYDATDESHSVIIRWVIENYSILHKNWEIIDRQRAQSSKFSADSDPERGWFLELYPNGKEGKYRGNISLYLKTLKGAHMRVGSSEKVKTRLNAALIDHQNNEKFKRRGRAVIAGLSWAFLSNTRCGFPKFAQADLNLLATERVLVDDRLTIECQISYGMKADKQIGCVKKCRRGDRQELVKDLENLFNSRKSSFDVILEVDGKELRAHKAILRARSPVFDAMFDHSFREGKENRVTIVDIGEDVFEAVLEFMYTADITRDVDFIELFLAADKYQIEELLVICEEEIASKLTVDTVCDVLLLADRYSAQELEKRVVQFIRTNYTAIKATTQWREFAETDLGFCTYIAFLVFGQQIPESGPRKWPRNVIRRTVTEVECNTRVTENGVIFRWDIDNYSQRDRNIGRRITSPQFWARDDPQTKWNLELYPNGYIERRRGTISLFIRNVSVADDIDEVAANFSFALIDDQNNEIQKISHKAKFQPGQYTGNDHYYSAGLDYLASKGLLDNDRLTIKCELSYDEEVESTIRSVKKSRRGDLELVIKDLENLYNSSQSDGDVVLEVDGKEIRAHKTILRARSPVFDAMFRDNQLFSEDRVKIIDIGEDVFEAVLEFLYTADLTRDVDLMELFYAADKYQMEELKAICKKEILSDMSVDTVCYVLLLADRHSEPELKEKAIQFIATNRTAVMATNQWTELDARMDQNLFQYVWQRLL